MGDLDSIQNNAGKISNRIDSLKKRWGIDTLNIVSHSKGGLDSRDYIEGANTVGTLVQLGTPNEGSPLANLAQAGSVALLGIAPTAIIDSFAAPAGIQLTTWNFGDNSARVKTQNPTHKYSKGGTYTVKLTVTNAAGATASKFVKIVVPKVVKPVANFTASSTSGKAPLTVTFTDTSKNAPTSWKWVFGDGKISTEQNPVHKYTKAGTYKVKLTVSNAAGTKTLSRYGYIVVS